jgi:hypothetical protein
LLTSLALTVGGAVIVLIGAYFWSHPEQYARYLHGASPWAAFNAQPPGWAVRFGAGLSVAIGLVVAGWGVSQLIF